MKKLLLLLFLAITITFAKAQTTVTIKEVVNYVGKVVTLCDSVYGAKAMGNISLLNLGGKFPKEIITVVILKATNLNLRKSRLNFIKINAFGLPVRLPCIRINCN